MRTVAGKAIAILLSLMILIFVGYQIFRNFYSPYQTETVVSYHYQDKLSANGLMLRQEQIITSKNISNQVIHYMLEDGGKVKKNGVVAEIYPTQTDALYQMEIKALDQELDLLKQSQDKGSVVATHPDLLNKQIADKVQQISDAIYQTDMSLLGGYKNDLQVLLNRRNLVIQKETDFEKRVTELTQKRNNLAKKISSKVKTVISSVPGNFVSSTDGFETSAVYNKVISLSVGEIDKLIKSQANYQPPDDVVGKVITDFHWHLVITVPIEENDSPARFKVGRNVTLLFPYLSVEKIPATISKIIYDDSMGKMAVFFESDVMTEAISSLRQQTVEVLFSTLNGHKVDKRAIRIVDGVKGVYVIMGQEMRFRSIDVIYEGSNFVLCDLNSSKSTLKPFDEVIVEGTDLYDRKPVK